MDTQDTSSSVFLFFDKQRFIFNAGEGLQRFCTEHKIKLSKIDHIFLSRVCSETAGGFQVGASKMFLLFCIPGLLLTLAGMGDEGMSVKIWGSSDLKYLVDAMRSFIPSAAMVHTQSFGPTPNADEAALSGLEKFMDPIVLVDDEVVKVSALLLLPGCSKMSQLKKGNSLTSDPSSIGLEVKSNQFLKSLQPTGSDGSMLKPGDISVIYICELPEIQGKFDPAKAVALGLKPGPKYRELQLGNSVMSDHQNIMVHPSDVLGPSIPGPIVIIVDCPTLPHLEEILYIQSLNGYYADSADHQTGGLKSVSCVIHLSPSSISTTSDYQNWMRRFGGAQHIMAGHEIKNMEIPILKSSARIAARLNYLCPQFFPAPGIWSIQSQSNGSNEFHLRPYTNLGLDKSGIPSFSSSSDIVHDLVQEIPEIVDSVEQINQLWHIPIENGNGVPSLKECVVMTEEPWMNADAPIPKINFGKNGVSESGEDLPSVSRISIDEVDMNPIALAVWRIYQEKIWRSSSLEQDHPSHQNIAMLVLSLLIFSQKEAYSWIVEKEHWVS
ncbi:hypothetical protein Sjap_019613 [Stephania japonica]|uniref:ribonuclease Z n=1 Tax=Stephania japonica TaxID=461633 RepID=A0AAP0HZW2_9MAGN